MKSSEKNTKTHILLFWSIPSISMIDAYKEKCNKLNRAKDNLKRVEVITYKNEILKLENVGIDSGRFFGLKRFKGKMKKVLLNINTIKTIILL
ncbi:MAG: hypothetical protein V7719_02465 [Psychroserpens sp.]|uniref:hypothetical protein n=1 Tax=Psychroserpens sp. TaxID=2020870 RepID=UPI0030036B00